jgi:hypothetical protein
MVMLLYLEKATSEVRRRESPSRAKVVASDGT